MEKTLNEMYADLHAKAKRIETQQAVCFHEMVKRESAILHGYFAWHCRFCGMPGQVDEAALEIATLARHQELLRLLNSPESEE